ncbi:F13E9.13 protein, mitochondrial, partial [Armadillidium nasatum]
MIHVKALPGTPRNKLSIEEIVECALNEVEIYKCSGVDGILIENMNDLPYIQAKDFGPEVVANMTRIASEVRKILSPKLPCGIQILAGGNKEALAVSQACGLQFIRCEGYVFSHVADEGWMDSCAGELLRYRKTIGCENVSVFVDIKKKHRKSPIRRKYFLTVLIS